MIIFVLDESVSTVKRQATHQCFILFYLSADQPRFNNENTKLSPNEQYHPSKRPSRYGLLAPSLAVVLGSAAKITHL
jgi:hypothetical protein